MTQIPAPPNRQPIMATRVLNAYKAYSRAGAGGGPGAARPLPPPAGRALVEQQLPEAGGLDDLKGGYDEQPQVAAPVALPEAEEVLASLQEMMRLLHGQGREA